MDATTDKESSNTGLKYAQDLTFSQETYEEAVKLVDCPDDANNLLKALLEVSERSSNTMSCSSSILSAEKDSVSSCYSSFEQSNAPSSSDLSLESLSGHVQQQEPLRKIYIDGPNVARSHGKDVHFSWNGIKICIDWFLSRQHKVKVFIPADRCERAVGDSEAEAILNYLIHQDALVKTPCGSNDDLYVIEAAKHYDGVIVSNDMFRDEKRFNEDLSNYIHQNRLAYVFVDDLFIPAHDPLGRTGPSLDEFLRSNYASFNSNMKLCRSRSHQRPLRSSYSLKYPRLTHSSGHRLNSLQYQSMPATRNFTSDSNQPSDSVTESHQAAPLISLDEQPRNFSNLHERHLKQQMQRAMTVGGTVQRSKFSDWRKKDFN